MLKVKRSFDENVYVNIYSSSFVYSMIAIAVVACLEIFMLIYTVVNAPLYGPYIGRYRAFYVALLTAALLYMALNLYAKKDLACRYKLLNAVNPFYVLFFFAWALGITYSDFVVTGAVDTTVFMTFSLVIPLGFYILPQLYAGIVFLMDVLMLCIIARASGGVGQVINVSIFIIFQLVLGVSFLLLKTRLAERIVLEEKNANVDALTGCGNRRAYNRALESLEREPKADLSYLAIDINGLKEVNDTLGHDAGDRLIVGAAGCIGRSFGEKGTVYRTGGDEFIVLTTEADPERLFPAYEERQRTWSAENGLDLTTSCGCARAADHPGVTITELARLADRRMFEAKARHYRESGRERRRQPAPSAT